MTGDESARVMARLTAGFDHRLADDTLQIWREELDDLHFSPAYAAARDMVRTFTAKARFPKIAEFLEAYNSAQHAQAGPKAECRGGCTNGWMGSNGDTVVACSVCNPAVFARQMDGGYQAALRGGWEPHTPDEILAARANIAAVLAQLSERAS